MVGRCIEVDANENISMVFVGYFGTVVQGYKFIGGTGIYYFHIFVVILKVMTQFKRYRQGYIFLLEFFAMATRILASMPGVYYNNPLFLSRMHSARPKAIYTYGCAKNNNV